MRPRHPPPSRGAAARAGGAEPACVEPGPWSRLEGARWNPAASSARGRASGCPPRVFCPGVAYGGGDPRRQSQHCTETFPSTDGLKLPGFSFSLSFAPNLGFSCWSCCRALGRRKPRYPCGVITETEEIGACVGKLHPRASLDSSWVAGPEKPTLGSRQRERRRWLPGSGTARAAPPSPHRSCRGHQPGEVEAPPAPSCAPTSSEGVAGGAWDAPSPQSVPESHSLAPRASAETAGRHGHPKLDVTKPRLGPGRRRLLSPRPPPAPASAMAPGMSGRGGAALLCLSALLAHGKCRGADSGAQTRRAPLEGVERSQEKANPLLLRRSQLGI